jgi:hypothetical protein
VNASVGVVVNPIDPLEIAVDACRVFPNGIFFRPR